MKHLHVVAAALGYATLERNRTTTLAGLSFKPADSVFPALTCTAQATFRTGLAPREHGMTSNGYYSRTLHKPAFWEQSCDLVHGTRVWSAARAAGRSVGVFFWQQSLGEDVDALISPAPIHKHGGGMVMRNYTRPDALGEILNRECGTFPLHRYWGPLAAPSVGRAVIANFQAFMARHPVDDAYLYLPTLDYAAQRHGPDSAADRAAFVEFRKQLEGLADYAAKAGATMSVTGDYAIGAVTRSPAFPNRTLRRAGLFAVRHVGPRAYPDFHAATAFALCDHEIAHVYLHPADDPDLLQRVVKIFTETGEYERVEVRARQDWAHPSAGEILLVAKQGSWCAYPWWTDSREAPDYATHIDIHNKPGYDPCELFFGRLFPPGTCQDATRIRGTHGRPSVVARAAS